MASAKNEKTGVVEAFNISPKGMFEGLLLKTAKKLIQVNFPPEAGALVHNLIAEGDSVTLIVEESEDDRPAEHPVFSLIKVKSPKAGLHLGSEPERVTVEGKVQRLNFARHGERNGAILENGDFIHLKPGGAKAVGLEIGMTLSVEGATKPSYVENRVIEAEVVNGIKVREHHAAKKSHAIKKHGPKKKQK